METKHDPPLILNQVT